MITASHIWSQSLSIGSWQTHMAYAQAIDVFETKKFAGNLFVHFVADFKGNFKVGDEILALVNNRHRQMRAQNHSSTHLLHNALKQVLGNSISQKGSNVDVKQLTFDFNLNRAMTALEIEQVEELVNFYIRQNSMVDTKEMELELSCIKRITGFSLFLEINLMSGERSKKAIRATEINRSPNTNRLIQTFASFNADPFR
jgi:alanyl-tRNA synthetase